MVRWIVVKNGQLGCSRVKVLVQMEGVKKSGGL